VVWPCWDKGPAHSGNSKVQQRRAAKSWLSLLSPYIWLLGCCSQHLQEIFKYFSTSLNFKWKVSSWFSCTLFMQSDIFRDYLAQPMNLEQHPQLVAM
jgi:hypothetical protein